MKCIVCHGEAISLAEVFEEIGVGSDIVRVPVTVMLWDAVTKRKMRTGMAWRHRQRRGSRCGS